MTLEVIPGKKEKNPKPHKCRSCLVQPQTTSDLFTLFQVCYIVLPFFSNDASHEECVFFEFLKGSHNWEMSNFLKIVKFFFVELMQHSSFPSQQHQQEKEQCNLSGGVRYTSRLPFFVQLKFHSMFLHRL